MYVMCVEDRLSERCEMCWAILFSRSVNDYMYGYRYCPYCGISLDMPNGA